MGALALIFFTLFWAAIGGALRMFIPNGPNKGVIEIGLALAAVCCYSLWICVYLAQLNPLFGPQLDKETFLMFSRDQVPN